VSSQQPPVFWRTGLQGDLEGQPKINLWSQRADENVLVYSIQILEEQFPANLHAMQTEEEAFASEERKTVKPILIAAKEALIT
jgi:hypothetical protein